MHNVQTQPVLSRIAHPVKPMTMCPNSVRVFPHSAKKVVNHAFTFHIIASAVSTFNRITELTLLR